MYEDAAVLASSAPHTPDDHAGVIVVALAVAVALVVLWRVVLLLVAVGFVTLLLVGALTVLGGVDDGAHAAPVTVLVPSAGRGWS